jgi:hypothetical protein
MSGDSPFPSPSRAAGQPLRVIRIIDVPLITIVYGAFWV